MEWAFCRLRIFNQVIKLIELKCCFFFKDQCFLCWYCFSLNTSVNYQASISHNRILFTMIHFHLTQSWAHNFCHPTCPWSEANCLQWTVRCYLRVCRRTVQLNTLFSCKNCSAVHTVQLNILLYSCTYYCTTVHSVQL